MFGHLRGDDAGERVPSVFHDGCRRIVAGAFDRENRNVLQVQPEDQVVDVLCESGKPIAMRRFVRLAVPSQINRYDLLFCRKFADVVLEYCCRLRPSVDHQKRFSFPSLPIMQACAVVDREKVRLADFLFHFCISF